MTQEERRARLKGWFTSIDESVTEAIVNQHIFWEVQHIIENNPQLQNTSSAFYLWMFSTFIHSMVLAVRRQVDGDKKSISLYRFLMELKTYPELISRSYHRSLYTRSDRPIERADQMADSTYDRHVGENASVLDVSAVQKEIDLLKAASRKIQHYADRIVAHEDARGLQQESPTFNDLGESLAALEKIVLRYVLLLNGADRLTLLPTFQYDWKSVFRVAWIPAD